MHGLANSYHDLKRHREALELRQEVLAGYRRALPVDHPDTLGGMTNVANSLEGLRRHPEALKMRDEAHSLLTRVLGPNHPDTLLAMHNLGNSLAALGRHHEALKTRKDSFAAHKMALSPDHPDTLRSMWTLILSLVKLDRSEEAASLIEECLTRAKGKAVHPGLLSELTYLRLRRFQLAKDPDGCRKTAEMWEELDRTKASDLYAACCMRAVASEVQAKSHGVDAENHSKDDADKAMDWLNKAVAAGFKNVEHMKKDKDLDALRGREDFKKLMELLGKGTPK